MIVSREAPIYSGRFVMFTHAIINGGNVMTIFSDATFLIESGRESDFRSISKIFIEKENCVDIGQAFDLYIDGSRKLTSIDDYVNLSTKIAKSYPHCIFSLFGIIKTIGLKKSYVWFEIKYAKNTITALYSSTYKTDPKCKPELTHKRVIPVK